MVISSDAELLCISVSAITACQVSFISFPRLMSSRFVQYSLPLECGKDIYSLASVFCVVLVRTCVSTSTVDQVSVTLFLRFMFLELFWCSVTIGYCEAASSLLSVLRVMERGHKADCTYADKVLL